MVSDTTSSALRVLLLSRALEPERESSRTALASREATLVRGNSVITQVSNPVTGGTMLASDAHQIPGLRPLPSERLR